jgi:hypothetical protein
MYITSITAPIPPEGLYRGLVWPSIVYLHCTNYLVYLFCVHLFHAHLVGKYRGRKGLGAKLCYRPVRWDRFFP